MCELFAMSSRLPANVSLSLGEFSRHGGQTDLHKDGWGIAYYHGRDALVIREASAAADSAQMKFVRRQKLTSQLAMSHIRKATIGAIALENTQPFSRELAGRMHVFIHNGSLPGVFTHQRLSGRFTPIGVTDSDYAFCLLMDRLTTIWHESSLPPPSATRLAIVSQFAAEMRTLGPANFIYADSDLMFAHGDKRTHSEGIRPPGLYSLQKSCKVDPEPVAVSGLTISTAGPSQDLVLLASVPLSDEDWQPLGAGEVLALQDGAIIDRVVTR